jgi:hypothetical protein
MRRRWTVLLKAVRVTALVVCAHGAPGIFAFFAADSSPVLR